MAVPQLVERGREVGRRRGVGGALRVAAERYAPGSRWSDEYVWYACDLRAEPRAAPRLDDGLVVRRGDLGDLGLLAQLPSDPEVTSLTEAIVRRRLDDGAELWLVVEGARLAFSCFTFTGRAPLTGMARDVALPDGVVLLEDSVSSPAFRGRGVAPAAWAAIARRQRAQGRHTMVTKVRVENAAVRRALDKAGFEACATMRRWSRLGRIHALVTATGSGPVADWLGALSR
jgi:RimJ/RimL family protein N-acetyltransferase